MSELNVEYTCGIYSFKMEIRTNHVSEDDQLAIKNFVQFTTEFEENMFNQKEQEDLAKVMNG